MKLDLRQLRYLLALNRHRNFARAAEAVGLTQPALSKSLSALEKAVGARLFDRDRSRVEPTQVGSRLIELAAPLVMQARLAERELVRMVGLAEGILRIGAGPYAAEISVGTAVGRLAAEHPRIRADVSVADWPELYRRLLADELDVVIAESTHAEEDDRFLVEPLPSHAAVFYCRSGHPLAGRPDVTLQDILAYPIAMAFVPRRMRDILGKDEPAGTDESARSPDTVATEFRIDTPQLARLIAMESDVIGAAVPLQIEQDVARGSLVTLPLHVPALRTNYGVLLLARRTPSPATVAFLQVLREVERGIERRMTGA